MAAAAAVAAASGWKQTLRAGSSKTGSAAGRPAGLAAPPQHTPLSKTPKGEDNGVQNLSVISVIIVIK